MKTHLPILFFLSSLCAIAQNPIPNPGFETWSGGSPISWTSNNIPTIATPVSQSNSSHSGNSAARLEAVNMFSLALPPTLFLTNPVSVNQDYHYFSFYFKGSLNPGDVLQAIFSLENNGNPIGVGSASISSANSSVYTFTSIPVIYTGSNATDADLNFVIGSNNASVTIGSYVILDDINVSMSVGLNENKNEIGFTLGQVYPNPVNEIGLIPFSLSKPSVICIELFSIDGKKIQTVLQSELQAGKYKAELDASALSSGVYLCKMSTNENVLYSKLVVE